MAHLPCGRRRGRGGAGVVPRGLTGPTDTAALDGPARIQSGGQLRQLHSLCPAHALLSRAASSIVASWSPSWPSPPSASSGRRLAASEPSSLSFGVLPSSSVPLTMRPRRPRRPAHIGHRDIPFGAPRRRVGLTRANVIPAIAESGRGTSYCDSHRGRCVCVCACARPPKGKGRGRCLR